MVIACCLYWFPGEGRTLRTVSLRCVVMYGEEDLIFIASTLRRTKKSNGKLTRVGSGTSRTQQGYVGNVAWAHVLASDALAKDETLGGEFFFITDDTPPMNLFDFIGIFLSSQGWCLSGYSLPYWPVYCLLYAVETLLYILSPFCRINSVTSCASLRYINSTVYFNSRKAETRFGYKPLFTYQESLDRSIEYYRSINV